MGKSSLVFIVLLLTAVPSFDFGTAPHAEIASAFAADFSSDPSEFPARIRIPSIGLDTPVIPVGLTANGEIEVPNGSTKNVGWYQYGKLPGDLGNAVFDAHVFAAFKNLRYAKIGDIISVVDAQGIEQRFRITSSVVYPVSDVPMENIILDESSRNIVLITCAKKFIRSMNTYSHRLVVTATRID